MTVTQFDQVSIGQLASVQYDGRVVGYTLAFKDGHQKILGVISPTSESVPEYELFTGNSSQRIEIIQGVCKLLTDDKENKYEDYRVGYSFTIPGNSRFVIRCDEVVQYIGHFEE